MTTKMKMILAGACLALAGCGGNGGGVAGIAGEALVSGPLGLVFGDPVDVMSADRQAENTVSVADDEATVTLNELTFDEDGNITSLSVTIVLPNGTEVTLDETSDIAFAGDFGVDGGTVIVAQFTTEEGDKVQVALGLGTETDLGEDSAAEIAAAALFLAARVDLADEEQGFNTYLVTGVETDTLPTGSANYSGTTVATLFLSGGENVIADLFGTATIDAFFATSTVDVLLTGTDGHRSYTLEARNIGITDSRYSGAFTSGTINICHLCDVELDGDVLGAFFGDNAEATAGVFAAEGETIETTVEIVGGFAAYKIAPNGGNNANIE